MFRSMLNGVSIISMCNTLEILYMRKSLEWMLVTNVNECFWLGINPKNQVLHTVSPEMWVIFKESLTLLVKNLVGGRTYYFRVLANSVTSYESSDEVKFPVPARVKHKAITAGVVGGILFFIVAIILSVCAVKICNKRKRRKQEKGILTYHCIVLVFCVQCSGGYTLLWVKFCNQFQHTIWWLVGWRIVETAVEHLRTVKCL